MIPKRNVMIVCQKPSPTPTPSFFFNTLYRNYSQLDKWHLNGLNFFFSFSTQIHIMHSETLSLNTSHLSVFIPERGERGFFKLKISQKQVIYVGFFFFHKPHRHLLSSLREEKKRSSMCINYFLSMLKI